MRNSLYMPLLVLVFAILAAASPCLAAGQAAEHKGADWEDRSEVPCTVDIQALRQRIDAEGWTYTVGENPATRYTLDQLCGLRVPDNWQEGARTIKPSPGDSKEFFQAEYNK